MISKNQQKYVRSLEQKKYRRRENAFVAEGPKVVGDLLEARFNARQIFATDEWLSQNAHDTAQVVTADELQRLSFLQHPQQVLAVFAIPEPSDRHSRLCLVLDGVQDPGNLGTIIRIADWFGITTIYCSEDTADAWSPKVVQATMGSIENFWTNGKSRLSKWKRLPMIPRIQLHSVLLLLWKDSSFLPC